MLNWPGREVNHSHSPNTAVQMDGAVLLLSLYDLMTWTGKSSPCYVELGSGMLVEYSGTEYRLFN